MDPLPRYTPLRGATACYLCVLGLEYKFLEYKFQVSGIARELPNFHSFHECSSRSARLCRTKAQI